VFSFFWGYLAFKEGIYRFNDLFSCSHATSPNI
jgi:hypothetical protein